MTTTTTELKKTRGLTAKEIESELACCTGTMAYHAIMPPFLPHVCTDGVVRMTELCGASWLITDIATMLDEVAKRGEDLKYFQLWELTVNSDRSAVLTCNDGNNPKPVYKHGYDRTSFPLESIRLYAQPFNEQGHFCILLTSEY